MSAVPFYPVHVAALMTDVYPPFRLDAGADDPGVVRWKSEGVTG